MNLYNIRTELNNGKNINDIKLRVTFYSRVSTDHILQHSSIINQSEYFYEYINSNNNWTYVKGYIDDGISGTTDIKRNNFMKMIGDAKKGLFDLIITKEISRFSRNTLDSIKYTRELLNYEVGVLFLNDNINTFLNDSELRLTIMASMAQDEIRRLSQRVKFGMNRSIKNGNILGNDMMYGYKKDKTTGNLNIIEKEAKIIKEIFNMYTIKNISINNIAKYLNTKTNKYWYASTISRIIKNPKYKGYYCSHKTVISDYMTKKIKKNDIKDWIMYKDYKKIPPIINEKQWNKANNKINKKNKNIKQTKYLLSSKIYCKKDNYVFYRRIINKEIRWICSNKLINGNNICKTNYIKEKEIDLILLDILNKLNIKTNYFNNQLNKLYNKQVNYNINKDILLNVFKENNILKIFILEDKIEIFLKNKIEFNKQYLFIRKKYNKENFILLNVIVC